MLGPLVTDPGVIVSFVAFGCYVTGFMAEGLWPDCIIAIYICTILTPEHCYIQLLSYVLFIQSIYHNIEIHVWAIRVALITE